MDGAVIGEGADGVVLDRVLKLYEGVANGALQVTEEVADLTCSHQNMETSGFQAGGSREEQPVHESGIVGDGMMGAV